MSVPGGFFVEQGRNTTQKGKLFVPPRGRKDREFLNELSDFCLHERRFLFFLSKVYKNKH